MARATATKAVRAGMVAWVVLAGAVRGVGAAAVVKDDGGVVSVGAKGYRFDVVKKGFRYSFAAPDGRVIAPAHESSGVIFGGSGAADAEVVGKNEKTVTFAVTNGGGKKATVVAHVGDEMLRLEVRPEGAVAEAFKYQPDTKDNSVGVVTRTGGVSPAYGLADHAGLRARTEVSGYVSNFFRGYTGQTTARAVSNFVIFPKHGMAEVNIEPGVKIVRLTDTENAQGSRFAGSLGGMYYFFGTPERIYANYKAAREENGYGPVMPKYEFFGVGWEAFGALAWNTNQKSVTEDVDRYLSLGFPLRWMVVGSGFWPADDENMRATTSFGYWDKNLYPDPRAMTKHFRDQGLKFFLGLRIWFIAEGPYGKEGVAGGYFVKDEAGKARVFRTNFPRKVPVYMLDGKNPAAVEWYYKLCRKWMDYGIDGFKEDLMSIYEQEVPDDKLDDVNRRLMKEGVYVMGRCSYLGGPSDIHRYDDFNYDQNQDRGPRNAFALAYSGFPNVYPDIVGGTGLASGRFKDAPVERVRTYLMREAEYAAVNPSMSVGYGPWNVDSSDGRVTETLRRAAVLHERLHPYIYSAAVDAYRTGFPRPLTPLPLAYPDDPNVYGLEEDGRRAYEWMIGESLLATPLYGNDYDKATSRDLYLPKGKWADFDTGEVLEGPKTLKGFELPTGKTPLFVGGKGILLLDEDVKAGKLMAVIYPVAGKGGKAEFTCRDGKSVTSVSMECDGGEEDVAVEEAGGKGRVEVVRDKRTKAIKFAVEPGRGYRVVRGR